MQLRRRLHHLLLCALALPGPTAAAGAAPPDEAAAAVVRVPSHGCSATVISTGPNRSYVLGCAHAFRGEARHKPLMLDVPRAEGAGGEHEAGIELLAVDYRRDLSLVRLDAGPLPFSAPVPARGYAPGRSLLSVGYDGMRTPAVRQRADLLGVQGDTTFTAQRPIPGRSGGALLDPDHGLLVGVVQGYETAGPRRGLYVSLPAILDFLEGQGWSVGKAPGRGPPEVPQDGGWRQEGDRFDDPFRPLSGGPGRHGRWWREPGPRGQGGCPPSG